MRVCSVVSWPKAKALAFNLFWPPNTINHTGLHVKWPTAAIRICHLHFEGLHKKISLIARLAAWQFARATTGAAKARRAGHKALLDLKARLGGAPKTAAQSARFRTTSSCIGLMIWAGKKWSWSNLSLQMIHNMDYHLLMVIEYVMCIV